MALNSTHSFDVHPISPKSNRVAHPDSGMLGETLYRINSEVSHSVMLYKNCETVSYLTIIYTWDSRGFYSIFFLLQRALEVAVNSGNASALVDILNLLHLKRC